jgi:hypothetical protein
MERTMRKQISLMACLALLASSAVIRAQAAKPSATAATSTIGAVLDAQLSVLETQFVAAAEAMPADRYTFAPENGAFEGVRTFALNVKHVATANTAFYSAILGRKLAPGITVAGAANGPDDIKTKPQVLAYLKDSFALGHKALAALTVTNALTPLATPVPSVTTRLGLAAFGYAHAWDHYGQMTAYLRLNGIVPPASAGQPPANPRREPTTATIEDSQHDFDFEFGTWATHIRRLLRPLSGSDEWVDLDGTSTVRKLWNGRANIGELQVAGAATQIEGLSLRVYDPAARQWSIYWANSRDGRLGTAMIGKFSNGRGEFFNQELFDGRAVYVRFVFSDVRRTSFRLEQAFSADGGKTWEPNWIATFTRQTADPSAGAFGQIPGSAGLTGAPFEVTSAPLPRRLDQRAHAATVIGDRVRNFRRHVRNDRPDDHAFALEIAQRGREHLLRDRRHSPAEVVESFAALCQPVQSNQAPTPADDLERGRQRAGRLPALVTSMVLPDRSSRSHDGQSLFQLRIL